MNNYFVSVNEDEVEQQNPYYSHQKKIYSYPSVENFQIRKNYCMQQIMASNGDNNIQKNTCENLLNSKEQSFNNFYQEDQMNYITDNKELRNISGSIPLRIEQKYPQSVAVHNNCGNQDEKNKQKPRVGQSDLNNLQLKQQVDINQNGNEHLGFCDILQQQENLNQNENFCNCLNIIYDQRGSDNYEADNINYYNFNNSSIFNQESTYYNGNLNNLVSSKEEQQISKEFLQNNKNNQYGQINEQIFEQGSEVNSQFLNQQTNAFENESSSSKQEKYHESIEDKKLNNKSSIEKLREYRQIKKRQKQQHLISRLQSLPKRILRSNRQENSAINEGENEVFQEQIEMSIKPLIQNEEIQSQKFQDLIFTKQNNTYYESSEKVNSFNNETMISTSYQFQNETEDNDLNAQFFQPARNQFYQDEVLSLSNQYSFEGKNNIYQSSNQIIINDQGQSENLNYYYNNDNNLNEQQQNLHQFHNQNNNQSIDVSHQNGSDKKNIVRNIMASFKRFIESVYDENCNKSLKSYQYQKTKFDIFLSQQEIYSLEETKKKVLKNLMELYNLKEEEKKINDQREFINTFKKYYDKKQFNNTTLHQLLDHKNFGPVFVYFLRSFFANWLQKNLIMNSQTHLQMRDQIIQLYEES